MAGAIMDKVWGLFGMDQGENEEVEDEDIYDYDDRTEYENNNNEEEDRKIFGRKGKVVPMTAQSQSVKMVISQPTTFEQSEEICSLLKDKKSVIVNLEYVNKDVARRIVDFISGGVYALDGHIQKISNSSILLLLSVTEHISEKISKTSLACGLLELTSEICAASSAFCFSTMFTQILDLIELISVETLFSSSLVLQELIALRKFSISSFATCFSSSLNSPTAESNSFNFSATLAFTNSCSKSSLSAQYVSCSFFKSSRTF